MMRRLTLGVPIVLILSSAASFQLQHEWQDAHRGRYLMEVFLFWPGAPAQYPRVIAGPVIVR